MNKKTLLILLLFIFFGLVSAVFQYVNVFKTDFASAYSSGKSANGHLWSEMECSNGLCITSDNNVGIGTDTPSDKLNVAGNMGVAGNIGSTGTVNATGGITTAGNLTATGSVGIGTTSPAQKLEVNGSILASGTGDICNGGGKCLSSVFQTNVIVGTNAVCPSGQTAIMKAYNGTWYTADNSTITTWTKVTCGAILSADGTALLVGSQHTSKNCTDGGGTVVGDGSGNNMCRFNAASCPSTWTQYSQWAATSAATCSCVTMTINGSLQITCSGQGYTTYHSWANSSTRETATITNCGYYNRSYNYGCGAAYNYQCCTCSATATVSQIGCY